MSIPFIAASGKTLLDVAIRGRASAPSRRTSSSRGGSGRDLPRAGQALQERLCRRTAPFPTTVVAQPTEQ